MKPLSWLPPSAPNICGLKVLYLRNPMWPAILNLSVAFQLILSSVVKRLKWTSPWATKLSAAWLVLVLRRFGSGSIPRSFWVIGLRRLVGITFGHWVTAPTNVLPGSPALHMELKVRSEEHTSELQS